MRYWVYKDAQILGPMSSEEISRIQEAGPDLLLCPEGTDGSRESDWKSAGEIPELAGLLPSRMEKLAPALQASEFEAWPARDFSLEEIFGLPYAQFWGPHSAQPGRAELELEAHQRRAGELESKLAELEAKIAQYERHQGDILDRLAEKDTLLEDREKTIQKLEKELEQALGLATKPSAPALTLAPAAPVEKGPEAPVAPAAQVQPESLLPPVPPPQPPLEKTPQGLDIPSVVTLPTIRQEVPPPTLFTPPVPMPAPLPAPPAIALPVPPPAAAAQPAMAPAPIPDPGGPFGGMPPFPESPVPPAAFGGSPAPESAAPSGYAPVPSDLQPPDPFSVTQPAMRTLDSPGTGPGPLGPGGSIAEPPRFSQAIGTPAPAEAAPTPPAFTSAVSQTALTGTVAAPKRSRGRKLWALAAVILLGMILGFLYLAKNDMMSPAQNKEASETEEPPVPGASSAPFSKLPAAGSTAPNPAASPASASPAGGAMPSNSGLTLPNRASGATPPGPGPASPVPATGSTAAGPSPEAAPAAQNPEAAVPQASNQAAPNPDYVADHSQEAIDLVKNHSLDRGRGTIAAWLQYSYPPGSREKWTANPGESAGSYIVQYQVTLRHKNSRKAAPPAYVFQADLGQASVQGFNQAAKDLLAGTAAKKSARKQATKRKRLPRALKPGEIPLLPLPTEADLQRARAAAH